MLVQLNYPYEIVPHSYTFATSAEKMKCPTAEFGGTFYGQAFLNIKLIA